MIKVAKKFYRKLCTSNDRQIEDPSMETMNIEVSCVNTSEIRKGLKGMNRGKAGGQEDLSIELIKDAGYFLLDILIIFFPHACKTVLYQVLGRMLQ